MINQAGQNINASNARGNVLHRLRLEQTSLHCAGHGLMSVQKGGANGNQRKAS
jgi:hypothetical protein